MINSLRQLLASPASTYASDRIIAYRPEGAVTWLQFWTQVNAWIEVLENTDDQLVALYERDSLEFFAALIALWRLGKQAVMPANNLPVTCHQLRTMTSAFAGDFPQECSPLSASSVSHLNLPGFPEQQSLAPSSNAALILFTSGSTGNPEPVAKCFAQLEAEITTLEELWGTPLKQACMTGSVSHQHIYGLLFRLLWPICSGRLFTSQARDYWEEFIIDAANFPSVALVTSPAHLSRIPDLIWPKAPIAIFSSGAPLSYEAASSASRHTGIPVTEIYGSTETGGIAWRQQEQGLKWTCFPGVSLRREQEQGLLQVHSAHLPDSQWFTTADFVDLDAEGRFLLCGRADRIAKVAGKRISLSAIERTLESHALVQHARVMQLPERHDRLGAVLVLTNEGNRFLIDQGKHQLNELLKIDLTATVDRVAIPRYWRYLAELPRNSQGKTTQIELQQLFNQDAMPRLPELLSCEQESASVLVFTFFIPSNLYYFDGHFPGRPVLPGVVQTHWAIHYARAHWGQIGEFAGLEVIKFQQVIIANQRLTLRLEYQANTTDPKRKLYFSYFSHSTQNQQAAHSSGRILFTEGAQ